jgi:hypothetical protein
MDELIDRLRAATVLVETHGSLAPMSWDAASRRDLVDGVLAIVEDHGGKLMAFIPRGDGYPITFATSEITAVSKRASAFNTVVDVQIKYDDESHTLCLVGPRGRMKRIFATAGHAIS